MQRTLISERLLDLRAPQKAGKARKSTAGSSHVQSKDLVRSVIKVVAAERRSGMEDGTGDPS